MRLSDISDALVKRISARVGNFRFRKRIRAAEGPRNPGVRIVRTYPGGDHRRRPRVERQNFLLSTDRSPGRARPITGVSRLERAYNRVKALPVDEYTVFVYAVYVERAEQTPEGGEKPFKYRQQNPDRAVDVDEEDQEENVDQAATERWGSARMPREELESMIERGEASEGLLGKFTAKSLGDALRRNESFQKQGLTDRIYAIQVEAVTE